MSFFYILASALLNLLGINIGGWGLDIPDLFEFMLELTTLVIGVLIAKLLIRINP